ncbi:hypothetical protein [Bifidobacterium pseudolongum]|jgi:hypothetical protein|uniref:Uncharacterized protein n=1 Tax=Bifidobacterium pseudolongum subsp. globosum TaxID=1690 RepID=A0A4Q5AS54_9BIFI|nr:hypothetical protein [Bifidobacterium pseudolongum]RYQ36315.1 hypothetical protein PG2003B_1152 [Bifidobacterium pseudolongum subsp. globosum]
MQEQDTHLDEQFCAAEGEIILPTLWVPTGCWWTQNKRGGWRKKHNATSTVKHIALLKAIEFKNQHPDIVECIQQTAHVHAWIIVHPLTGGRFDPENASPMGKAIIDALTVAGYWTDDDSTHLTGPDYRPGTRAKTQDGCRPIGIHLKPINTKEQAS